MPEPRLPAPRALLFDWDNTLVDSWRNIHHALHVTFEHMGQTPWTLEETRQRVRASARDSFPRLFGERAQEASEIFFATYERDHLDKLDPLPGSAEMLSGLSERKIPLGVVSNKLGRLLRKETAHLGWDAHFAGIVGAGDATRDKPALDPIELALTGTGLTPGPDVWFVGDTDIDLLCAAAGGCTRVLIRAEPPGDGEFPGHEPHLHLVSCGELAEAVAARQGG